MNMWRYPSRSIKTDETSETIFLLSPDTFDRSRHGNVFLRCFEWRPERNSSTIPIDFRRLPHSKDEWHPEEKRRLIDREDRRRRELTFFFFDSPEKLFGQIKVTWSTESRKVFSWSIWIHPSERDFLVRSSYLEFEFQFSGIDDPIGWIERQTKTFAEMIDSQHQSLNNERTESIEKIFSSKTNKSFASDQIECFELMFIVNSLTGWSGQIDRWTRPTCILVIRNLNIHSNRQEKISFGFLQSTGEQISDVQSCSDRDHSVAIEQFLHSRRGERTSLWSSSERKTNIDGDVDGHGEKVGHV